MQITFRPNHDRPPKKFKPPFENVNAPAVVEQAEPAVEEASKAKIGFIIEENNATEQEQLQVGDENINEPMLVDKDYATYSGCKPGCPGDTPGYPEYPPYPDCKPGYPDYPNPEPEEPENRPDHVCEPYPYPGNYYPLQCLGYAYIPWQKFISQYQPHEALAKGTLFPELFSPYFPERKPPVIPRPYCNMWQCPNMMRKRKR